MRDNNRIGTVILAGGEGKRFGAGKPKQFATLGGRTLIERVVSTYLSEGSTDEFVVVSNVSWLADTRDILEKHLGRQFVVVEGGDSRNESIAKGVHALPADIDLILVQDAVRPMVSAAIVQRVLDQLASAHAVLPVIPSVDALVSVTDQTVEAFVERQRVMRGQTPQGFQRPRLVQGLARLTPDDLAKHTTIFEALLNVDTDLVIRTVPGEEQNIKVTVPLDHAYAEFLLEAFDEE